MSAGELKSLALFLCVAKEKGWMNVGFSGLWFMIDLLYKGGKNEGKKKGLFIKKIVSETDAKKLYNKRTKSVNGSLQL